MLFTFAGRTFAALALLATASTATAQGSWLPYGTLGASDIAVSPSGVVWLIGREPNSIRTTLVLAETQFFTPRGSPARVAVDLNGFPWLLNADGTLHHFVRSSAGKEEWELVPLKAIDIAVGSSGAVWAIDAERRIVRLRSGAWESIGGAGVKIAVDPSGDPWVVSPSGDVAHWTGSGWTQIPARATDISISPDGTVFILGTTPVPGGFPVFRLNGSSWEPLAGGAGIAISAGTQAVFVAQDAPRNMVVSSANSRLRVATAEDQARSSNPQQATNAGAGEVAGPSRGTDSAPAVPAVADAAAAKPAAAGSSAGSNDKSGSGTGLPSAGSVVGGAAGLLGGLLSKGASVAAAVPVPVPPQGAIASAVAGAAAGAAAGVATGVAGDVLSGAASSVLPGSGPSSAASNVTQDSPAKVENPQESPKVEGPQASNVVAPKPSPRIPLPGGLKCPVIGGGELMERGCELVGREALKLWNSSTADCTTANVPPGYGTPFVDSSSSGGCYVCPVPLQRSLASVRSITRGNLAACAGKAKQLLVWQFGQYPEEGAYRFMPGLLSIALADPKAVDAFLNERANGDIAKKQAMWAAMIDDPSSSAELKALLFASLIKVAKEDSSTGRAREALGEFESYMRARRTYVADEALRMYKKARDVDAYYQQVKDSGGVARVATETAGSVVADFKTYAWSAVLPDSAGTAFIAASSALSQLAAAGDSIANGAVASLNVRYLAPVTKALHEQLASLGDPAMIATTLLGGAMKFSKGFMSVLGRDDHIAEYEKYVEEMKSPLRVKDMVDSINPEDRQTLLLLWALATSPHKASDTIGTGAMTGAELCNADSWTAAECSSAKTLVLAAAKAAGYSN